MVNTPRIEIDNGFAIVVLLMILAIPPLLMSAFILLTDAILNKPECSIYGLVLFYTGMPLLITSVFITLRQAILSEQTNGVFEVNTKIVGATP